MSVFGGGQVQRFSRGTPASACSMCFPHPAHVGFPQCGHWILWHIGAGFSHDSAFGQAATTAEGL